MGTIPERVEWKFDDENDTNEFSSLDKLCITRLIHVIFVIGGVFVYVELSNAKCLIFVQIIGFVI